MKPTNIKNQPKKIIIILLHKEHHQKKKMTLSKIHKFRENFNLPYGYFKGREILPHNGSKTRKKYQTE